MTAVDTSALVAIGLHEPERAAFTAVVDEATKVLIGSVSVMEAKMVPPGVTIMTHGRLALRRIPA